MNQRVLNYSVLESYNSLDLTSKERGIYLFEAMEPPPTLLKLNALTYI